MFHIPFVDFGTSQFQKIGIQSIWKVDQKHKITTGYDGQKDTRYLYAWTSLIQLFTSLLTSNRGIAKVPYNLLAVIYLCSYI